MATIGGPTYVMLSQSPAGLLGASNLTNGFPVRCVRDSKSALRALCEQCCNQFQNNLILLRGPSMVTLIELLAHCILHS